MKLYRAFATVGGLTMLSRLLGFVRDIMIAAALGTGWIADAFFVAFRFPNLFRRLFAEGAFNSAFVPLFAKKLEGEGEAAARSFAEEALAGLLFVLLLVTALAEIAMPWLMLLLAPGFTTNPEKFDLAVLLTRIAFPYLICMSLVALLSGVLNSLHRFAAAAVAPVLLNVVLIAAMGLVLMAGYRNSVEAGIVLAWGVAFAGVVQLLLLAVAAWRAGMGLGFRRPRMTDGMRKLVRLGIPGVVSGGITQINIVIGTIIASLQAGAVSYLYYADRIYQLPLGIVGVAIGVVLLPDLTRKLRAGDEAAAMDSQNRSLEFGMFLTLPASVALAVLAEPIVSVLYERGAFAATDARATAAALAAFAWGLPAFVLQKVFQPGFFAREDTRTPMRFAFWNMLVNVIGSIILFFGFQAVGYPPHVGIALATTLAGWLNTGLLWAALVRRGHFVADARLRRNMPLILAASIVMGAVVWIVGGLIEPWLTAGNRTLVRFTALAGLVGLGLAVFFAGAHVTGAMRVGALKRALRQS